ncbi:MAG: DUF350 domain-containing protein [Saccharospirillaceae bacterium]|nr:DUF350 domain-containing protein [Pseudomonadales bacterium]NRB79509.1 DUF350 domain-containing protein [Saccharospirillaceae bacterium]
MDISELLSFAAYFSISLVLMVLFKIIYTMITPHDEWKLIKENKNTAAALGLGGAVIGFAIAISGTITNSISILDFVIWSVVALVAQTLAFLIVRFVFMPKIVSRIENDEVSAGIMLAAVSISVGLLNAACMTY